MVACGSVSVWLCNDQIMEGAVLVRPVQAARCKLVDANSGEREKRGLKARPWVLLSRKVAAQMGRVAEAEQCRVPVPGSVSLAKPYQA